MSGSAESEALYQQVLGRAGDPGGVAYYTSALGDGATPAQVARSLATGAEAQTDLNDLYESVLGRPADSEGLASYTDALATGTSLDGVRSDLAHSAEAQSDLAGMYQRELGRSPDAQGLSSFTQALASGASLTSVADDLANSTEAHGDIANLYASTLGRAADPDGLSYFTTMLANGGSLTGVMDDLANSGEAISNIDDAYVASTGALPNPVALAAYQSELLSGFSLATVRTQIGELSGGAPPTNIHAEIAITPETIGGASPNLIYGLAANDALIASGPRQVQQSYGGDGEMTTIQGFNAATDIIQLPAQQGGSFANLSLTNGESGVVISAGHGSGEILLTNIQAGALHAANFRFT